MKKLFTIVASAILVGASTFATITWGDVGEMNLAKGAAVTVSSNPNDAALIADDNNGSGWQASAATHAYTQDWVILDLGESKAFTDMEIVWEASHCKDYSVYVSATPFTVEPKTETIGEGEEAQEISYNAVSVEGLTAAATAGNDSEANYIENITFNEPQNGQYVLIYANEYNNFGTSYGMRLFEVRLANIENREALTSVKVAQEGNAVAGADAATLTLTAANTVSASTFGIHTLTATATMGETTVSATYELNVAFNWSGVTNVANGKTIQGRIKADAEDTNPVANAVDANEPRPTPSLPA